jgi:hypothetical protein
LAIASVVRGDAATIAIKVAHLAELRTTLTEVYR